MYFHMRVADSYIVDKQPGKAVEHAKAGTQLAREHGLLDKQVCNSATQQQFSPREHHTLLAPMPCRQGLPVTCWVQAYCC